MENTPLLQLPSPLQRLPLAIAAEKKVEVWMKRDDLIHPLVGGNKWRKLKYNLIAAGKKPLLTFGGAWSNHIHATAAAGKLYGIPTIGIIRGEEPAQWSDTLSFAREQGMQLKFIPREEYRHKEEERFIHTLKKEYGEFHLVPEGGSNAEGVRGCHEIAEEIAVPFGYLCTPCGTGTTLAGLAAACHQKTLMGFSALKDGSFLQETIHHFTPGHDNHIAIISAYSLGGYAKVTPELFDYIVRFCHTYNILLDPVYTGKMMMGLEDLLRNDYFPAGSVIIALHTGGVQGISGFPDLHRALFAR